MRLRPYFHFLSSHVGWPISSEAPLSELGSAFTLLRSLRGQVNHQHAIYRMEWFVDACCEKQLITGKDSRSLESYVSSGSHSCGGWEITVQVMFSTGCRTWGAVRFRQGSAWEDTGWGWEERDLDTENLIWGDVRGPEKGSILSTPNAALTLGHENLHHSEL